MTILRLLCLALLSGGCSAPGGSDPAGNDVASTPLSRTSRTLQVELMSFADGFIMAIANASNAVESELTSPEERLAAHRWKLGQATAAIINATRSSGHVGLLDMTVLVTLGDHVLENHWIPNVWGEAGQPLLDTYRQQREEIWDLARRVLTEEEEAELGMLIRLWTEAHPEVVLPSLVHFSDFSELRDVTPQEAARRKGSLFGLLFIDPLAGLDPTTREIEQARYLAERAMYHGQRLPTLARWEAELLFSAMLAAPQVQELVQNSGRVTRVSEELSSTIQALPEKISAERMAAIDQAMDRVSEERTQFVANLETILPALSQLVESIQATVRSVDRVVARLDTGEKKPAPAKPFDIEEYRLAASTFSRTADEFTELMDRVYETLNSPGFSGTVPEIGGMVGEVRTESEALLDHAFWLGAALIALALVLAVVASMAYRLVTVRFLRPAPAGPPSS